MVTNIFQRLAIGDLRTTGIADEIARSALSNPKIINQLITGLTVDDQGVRMRAADALEKIGHQQPKLLLPYKQSLIKIAEESQQKEVQWHMAQMLGYFDLTKNEATKIVAILTKYYAESSSNIVKVFSLTTLVAISQKFLQFRVIVTPLLEEALISDKPSVRSRANKLIKNF